VYIATKPVSNTTESTCDNICQTNIANKVASLIKIPTSSCDAICQQSISESVSKTLTPAINKQVCDDDCRDSIACRVFNNKSFYPQAEYLKLLETLYLLCLLV
jgi:hypothetical protein